MVTNLSTLVDTLGYCCDGTHEHTRCTGTLTKAIETYPRLLTQGIHDAVRRHNKQQTAAAAATPPQQKQCAMVAAIVSTSSSCTSGFKEFSRIAFREHRDSRSSNQLLGLAAPPAAPAVLSLCAPNFPACLLTIHCDDGVMDSCDDLFMHGHCCVTPQRSRLVRRSCSLRARCCQLLPASLRVPSLGMAPKSKAASGRAKAKHAVARAVEAQRRARSVGATNAAAKRSGRPGSAGRTGTARGDHSPADRAPNIVATDAVHPQPVVMGDFSTLRARVEQLRARHQELQKAKGRDEGGV